MIWADGQEWGTATELARRFGVSASTIYKWRDPKEWKNPADALTKVRMGGLDYSPVVETSLIDRAKLDETRGAPRLVDTTAA